MHKDDLHEEIKCSICGKTIIKITRYNPLHSVTIKKEEICCMSCATSS